MAALIVPSLYNAKLRMNMLEPRDASGNRVNVVLQDIRRALARRAFNVTVFHAVIVVLRDLIMIKAIMIMTMTTIVCCLFALVEDGCRSLDLDLCTSAPCPAFLGDPLSFGWRGVILILGGGQELLRVR